jgi:1-acyl-sn-glycerol-3-phosphate acyltransferase
VSGAAAGGASEVSAWGLAVRRSFSLVGAALARYTRLEFEGPQEIPDAPVLLVVNHGHGGIFDLNGFALAALQRRFGIDDRTPATILTHQIAWTVGAGPLLEPAGFRPASREVALEALEREEYVVVMPGGDLDGAKSWAHRNEVLFGGRTGFASLAMQAGVPIVPLVIVGAGESLFVLSDGRRLAEALRLDQLLRTRTLPVAVSIPWGITFGGAGVVLPYVPLPTKLVAVAGDPMTAEPGESVEDFAARVQGWMSATAERLTEDRVPILGWRRRRHRT